MTALSRSDAFAFLVPVSTDAAEVLKLRVNKALLEDAKFSDHLILHKSFSRGERPYVVKLDYALLFGRPCLTFGSSRCNEFQFPKAVDIGASHFVLHFEMQTGVFLLTDISPSGTFISTHPTQGLKRLHRATYPLLQTSYIHLGREQRYRFQITLAPYMRDLSAFTNLFREYAQSVDQPLPACIKDIRAIKTPLVTLDEKYINLHGVGQSKFEVVHTCIRISDGRLLAIKQSHDQVADPSQHLSRVNQQQARREIQLLRGVRHVSSLCSP